MSSGGQADQPHRREGEAGPDSTSQGREIESAEAETPAAQPLPGDQPLPGMAAQLDIKGTRWQGLTPPASEIEQLYHLDPEIAKRTLALYESKQEHVHELERTEQQHAHTEDQEGRRMTERTVRRGSWMALSLGFGVLLVSAFVASVGQGVAAGAISVIGFGTLGVALIRGPRQRKPQTGQEE